jgi:hypothetical protein
MFKKKIGVKCTAGKKIRTNDYMKELKEGIGALQQFILILPI